MHPDLTKPCKNCRHFSGDMQYPRCKATSSLEHNPVTGKTRYIDCYPNRASGAACGPNGALFEAAAPIIKAPTTQYQGKPVIIYEPHGGEKTRHAAALAAYFGKCVICDDIDAAQASTAAHESIVFTNAQPKGVDFIYLIDALAEAGITSNFTSWNTSLNEQYAPAIVQLAISTPPFPDSSSP